MADAPRARRFSKRGLVFDIGFSHLAGGCVYRSSGDGDDYADILVRRGREK